MGKRCVIGGCSNTNHDGVSAQEFPKGEALCENGTVLCDTPVKENLAGSMLCSIFPKSPSITKTVLSGKWDSQGNWI